MAIYYFMVEAVPNKDNPESEIYTGAFVNIWAKSESEEVAFKKVQEYLALEGWTYVKTEDFSIAHRAVYTDIPEALECYDAACECGIGGAFYTWSDDDGPRHYS